MTHTSPRPPLAPLAAATLACLCAAAASPAQPHHRHALPDPRIDAATGRDMRIWPPDRPFDHRRMRLVLTFPDMSRPAFDAVETLSVAPIGAPRSSISLDAGPALGFSAVTVGGRPATYTHADGRLTITFPGAVEPGGPVDIVMTYHAESAGGRGEGLTWSDDDPTTPQQDFMFHSQGESQLNHLWFACHDFPNQRLSTELVVTVPEGYQAVSNGRLASVAHTPASGDRPASATFDWIQDASQPVYLVSLVIGRFDVVNLGGPHSARPGLWMPVYGPLGSAETIKADFARTPEMVAFFEKTFDEPYPWAKYAQVLARNFAAGGMENTSATTFAVEMIRVDRSELQETIAHELAHQWFGDLVTCRSWEHLWLNEGWASFAEALWAEHTDGRDAYMKVIRRFCGAEIALSRTEAPAGRAMASHLYTDPDQRFYSQNNVYSKGAVVLHMLRMRLGDDAFFRGAALYLDRMKHGLAETDDFRKALEDASGLSLERFFDQWVYRPALPRLRIDLTYSEGTRRLDVTVKQTQPIDAANPAWRLDLPILLDEGAPTQQVVTVAVDGEVSSASFACQAKPSSIKVDPDLTVLASKIFSAPFLHEAPPEHPDDHADQTDAAADAASGGAR